MFLLTFIQILLISNIIISLISSFCLLKYKLFKTKIDILLIQNMIFQLFISLYLFLFIFSGWFSTSDFIEKYYFIEYTMPSFLIIFFMYKSFIAIEDYKSRYKIYYILNQYSGGPSANLKKYLRYEFITFLIILLYCLLEGFKTFEHKFNDTLIIEIDLKYIFIFNYFLLFVLLVAFCLRICYFLLATKIEKSRDLSKRDNDGFLKFNYYHDIMSIMGSIVFLAYLIFLFIFVQVKRSDFINLPTDELTKYSPIFYAYSIVFNLTIFNDNIVFFLKLYNSNLYFYYLQNVGFFSTFFFLFGRKSNKKTNLVAASVEYIVENYQKYVNGTINDLSNVSNSETKKKEPEVNESLCVNNVMAKEICFKLELYFEDYVITNSNSFFDHIFKSLHQYYSKYTGNISYVDNNADILNLNTKMMSAIDLGTIDAVNSPAVTLRTHLTQVPITGYNDFNSPFIDLNDKNIKRLKLSSL